MTDAEIILLAICGGSSLVAFALLSVALWNVGRIEKNDIIKWWRNGDN